MTSHNNETDSDSDRWRWNKSIYGTKWILFYGLVITFCSTFCRRQGFSGNHILMEYTMKMLIKNRKNAKIMCKITWKTINPAKSCALNLADG